MFELTYSSNFFCIVVIYMVDYRKLKRLDKWHTHFNTRFFLELSTIDENSPLVPPPASSFGVATLPKNMLAFGHIVGRPGYTNLQAAVEMSHYLACIDGIMFGGGNHHFVHPCTNPDAVATGALCSAFIPLYVSRPLWLLIRDRPVYVVNVIEQAVGPLMFYKRLKVDINSER
ncbi:hypothetical protein EGR_01645 [Echinococcus granulosus]|uniref:Uncharacterized protein n=1 Tax=Echinococcus granulosus TaxID=6210 RepID=W6UQR3_ECHGR|nr:hypothetical protein EGR_01645 [Echinococcus granulosus]EUB63563.1 hypothetical protein EGR_01645 [Echinococcus granulosus]